MKTLKYIPADQQTLLDAVTAYETHRNVPAGHYTTSPAADDNGTHLHLRTPRPGTDLGSAFHGIATSVADGIRITRAGTCPLCAAKAAPAGGYLVRHDQIGAAR